METRLKEVLAVVNNKGGVGKTTTVQSLAAAMMRYRRDWRILVIDLDPQGDLTKLIRGSSMSYTCSVTEAMSGDNGNLTIFKGRNGIYYVPSSPELQKIEPRLMEQMQPYMVLRRLLLTEFIDNTPDGIITFEEDSIKPKLCTIPDCFDYVLIDCPPALSMCTYNAMAVASGLLIPVQMEGLSVSGLAPVIVEMERVKRELNPQLFQTEHCEVVCGVSPSGLWRQCVRDDDSAQREDQRGADQETGYLRIQAVEPCGHRLRAAV